MRTIEIYNGLCQFFNTKMNGEVAPSELKAKGVKVEAVPDNRADIITHDKYFGDDGGTVEVVIKSYDHSRTFELRTDSNDIYVSMELNGERQSSDFLICDKE